jgi:hypothetical protein
MKKEIDTKILGYLERSREILRNSEVAIHHNLGETAFVEIAKMIQLEEIHTFQQMEGITVKRK